MDELRLKDFYKQFPTEDVCLEYLEKMRWPEVRACPHCGAVKTYKFKDGRLFKCGECRKQFTAKVGTIFTDSHIPLQDWCLAVYLLTTLKKGISSVRLADYLHVTQKTAWFMLQRIRYAMEYGTMDKPLDGIIEADETYIGGRTTIDRKHKNKVAVMGMVERKKSGHIVTMVTKIPDATVAMPFIRAYAKQKATLHTDESRIYNRLKREYTHEYVTHAASEYVRGDVTTNTIEGAWAHLKLGLRATYMGRVTAKHLAKYTGEFGFRYNTRDLTGGERFEEWFKRINGTHLPYRTLIG